jgi:predicted ATPase with chaperone activity
LEVEVGVGSARIPGFNVVGLPDNAVKESRERIKSAMRNCGYEFPHRQGVTINLAPADVRKKMYSNAQMMPKSIRRHCAISAEGEKLLENAVARLGLSARAHDRILKVARTIVDLDGSADIEPKHLSEATRVQETLARSYWA